MPVSLAQRFAEQSTDELLAVCIETPADYSADALQLATEILAQRGVVVAAVQQQRAAERLAVRLAADATLQQSKANDAALLAQAHALLSPLVCMVCNRHTTTQQLDLQIARESTDLGPHTAELPVAICRTCTPAFVARRQRLRAWTVASYTLGVLALSATVLMLRATRSFAWLGLALVGGIFALPGYVVDRRDRLFRERIFAAHPAAATLRSAGFYVQGTTRRRDAVAEQVKMLSHGELAVEACAVAALQALGTSEVVHAVVAAFANPAATANCAEVLKFLRPLEAVPALRELAANANQRLVRDMARDVLVHVGETPPQPLPNARVVK